MARVRGRSRRELKSEINIVPLLDVLLVLLLIFMATAPIITQSVEVDLPDATDSKTVSSDDNPPVILEVSGVGQYTLVVDHIEYSPSGGRGFRGADDPANLTVRRTATRFLRCGPGTPYKQHQFLGIYFGKGN